MGKPDAIYLSKLTTCYVGGERGFVALIHYPTPADPADGVFVRLAEREAMLYVDIRPDGSDWPEILGWRQISRDEFDHLTGLTDARRSMGWDIREETAA